MHTPVLYPVTLRGMRCYPQGNEACCCYPQGNEACCFAIKVSVVAMFLQGFYSLCKSLNGVCPQG